MSVIIEIDGKLWKLKDHALYCPDCNYMMKTIEAHPFKEDEKKIIAACPLCYARVIYWWWEWLEHEASGHPFEPVEPSKGETKKP